MQLSECATFEGDILFSVLFATIIYPVCTSWIVGQGWLKSLGFEDPAHATACLLLGSVSGFVGNIMVGTKFEHKRNVFSLTYSNKG